MSINLGRRPVSWQKSEGLAPEEAAARPGDLERDAGGPDGTASPGVGMGVGMRLTLCPLVTPFPAFPICPCPPCMDVLGVWRCQRSHTGTCVTALGLPLQRTVHMYVYVRVCARGVRVNNVRVPRGHDYR